MRFWTSCVAVLAALVMAVPAAAAKPRFMTPIQLKGPAGGEPSIATDPQGDVFIAGPQGIPSGLNDQAGTGLWVSRDDGKTFGPGRDLGSFLGGGDDDVLYSKGAVYLTDLEAIASEVCKSTDRGKTFNSIGAVADPDHCSHVGIGQVGPSDDRQWLTTDRSGTLYLTYHEFVSAQPIAFRSDNGGKDLFANVCGPLVTDPTIEANVPTDITGGTLVARPVTDKAGNLYVLFASTTQQQNVQAQAMGMASGTFSQLYLAVSHDHCRSFTDYTIFDGSKIGTNTVQFGDIFNDLAIDGAGNLYAIGVGYIGKKAFDTKANVYVLHSTDHGRHWSKPLLIGSTHAAHMLPAAVGGRRSGQLEIGYFRTVNGVIDPNSSAGKWTYGTAQSSNAAGARPTFRFHDVRPGFIYHSGQICNAGILCGAPGEPSDRSLLDFTSAALDTHGCPLFTFAGNPQGASKGTWNYVTRQQVGCFAAQKKHHKKKHK